MSKKRYIFNEDIDNLKLLSLVGLAKEVLQCSDNVCIIYGKYENVLCGQHYKEILSLMCCNNLSYFTLSPVNTCRDAQVCEKPHPMTTDQSSSTPIKKNSNMFKSNLSSVRNLHFEKADSEVLEKTAESKARQSTPVKTQNFFNIENESNVILPTYASNDEIQKITQSQRGKSTPRQVTQTSKEEENVPFKKRRHSLTPVTVIGNANPEKNPHQHNLPIHKQTDNEEPLDLREAVENSEVSEKTVESKARQSTPVKTQNFVNIQNEANMLSPTYASGDEIQRMTHRQGDKSTPQQVTQTSTDLEDVPSKKWKHSLTPVKVIGNANTETYPHQPYLPIHNQTDNEEQLNLREAVTGKRKSLSPKKEKHLLKHMPKIIKSSGVVEIEIYVPCEANRNISPVSGYSTVANMNSPNKDGICLGKDCSPNESSYRSIHTNFGLEISSSPTTKAGSSQLFSPQTRTLSAYSTVAKINSPSKVDSPNELSRRSSPTNSNCAISFPSTIQNYYSSNLQVSAFRLYKLLHCKEMAMRRFLKCLVDFQMEFKFLIIYVRNIQYITQNILLDKDDISGELRRNIILIIKMASKLMEIIGSWKIDTDLEISSWYECFEVMGETKSIFQTFLSSRQPPFCIDFQSCAANLKSKWLKMDDMIINADLRREKLMTTNPDVLKLARLFVKCLDLAEILKPSPFPISPITLLNKCPI